MTFCTSRGCFIAKQVLSISWHFFNQFVWWCAFSVTFLNLRETRAAWLTAQQRSTFWLWLNILQMKLVIALTDTCQTPRCFVFLNRLYIYAQFCVFSIWNLCCFLCSGWFQMGYLSKDADGSLVYNVVNQLDPDAEGLLWLHNLRNIF